MGVGGGEQEPSSGRDVFLAAQQKRLIRSGRQGALGSQCARII